MPGPCLAWTPLPLQHCPSHASHCRQYGTQNPKYQAWPTLTHGQACEPWIAPTCLLDHDQTATAVQPQHCKHGVECNITSSMHRKHVDRQWHAMCITKQKHAIHVAKQWHALQVRVHTGMPCMCLVLYCHACTYNEFVAVSVTRECEVCTQ